MITKFPTPTTQPNHTVLTQASKEFPRTWHTLENLLRTTLVKKNTRTKKKILFYAEKENPSEIPRRGGDLVGRISRGKGYTFGGLEILKHSGNHESKRDNILNGEGEERLIDVGIQPCYLPFLL